MPWQPVPQCLTTLPPEQPKCETCESFQDFWDRVIEHPDNKGIGSPMMNKMFSICEDAWHSKLT